MKKYNNKFNLGFSLLEILMTISISVIVAVAISEGYDFILREQLRTTRESNVKVTIDTLKNTMLSEYKYHRGDIHLLTAYYLIENSLSTNMNPIRLLSGSWGIALVQRSTVNGSSVGWKYGGYYVGFPLTPKEMETYHEYANTKMLTIEQKFTGKLEVIPEKSEGEDDGDGDGDGEEKEKEANQDNPIRIQRMEYTMRCVPLPENIKQILVSKNVRMPQLLTDSGFFSTTKCIQNAGTQYAAHNHESGAVQFKRCGDYETIVIQKDVWTDWEDRNDQSIHASALTGSHDMKVDATQYLYNDKRSKELSRTYPQTISLDNVLGIAFCTWVPSEEDLVTANNTEVELYYYSLDYRSFLGSSAKLKLDVKKERVSLHRDSSLSTKLYPLKTN